MKSKVNISFIMLFSFFFFVSINELYAKKVDSFRVRVVALNAYAEFTGISKNQLEISESIPVFREGELVYTIFNFKKYGHIVVTNEDCAEPILGYGLKSHLKPGELNPGLEALLNGYSDEIMFIRKQKVSRHNSIQQKWDYYGQKNDTNISLKSYTAGNHLIQTNWGQESPYNNDCPVVPGTNKKCIVGCNGVALAQLLNLRFSRIIRKATIAGH